MVYLWRYTILAALPSPSYSPIAPKSPVLATVNHTEPPQTKIQHISVTHNGSWPILLAFDASSCLLSPCGHEPRPYANACFGRKTQQHNNSGDTCDAKMILVPIESRRNQLSNPNRVRTKIIESGTVLFRKIRSIRNEHLPTINTKISVSQCRAMLFWF